MDQWLSDNEIDTIIQQLNPQLQTGTNIDANWQRLRLEQTTSKPLIDFSRTVKTQSPTLMLFEKNMGFVYRRFDGAHWHTELRDISGERAFTPEQSNLKDLIDTVQAMTHQNFKLIWVTPVCSKTQTFDPRYQLIEQQGTWYCCINNKVYQESNRRTRSDRGYVEITFSTREEPVFDTDSLNLLLNKLCRSKANVDRILRH